jgi:hypothetical protein
MTNTLTYSNATVSTLFGANSANASFGLINYGSADPRGNNPWFFQRPATQILEGFQTLSKQARESLTDHAALLMVAGVVTGMFGMATAIGVSL